jgi:DNA-binding CsgD family transcriptional regulator
MPPSTTSTTRVERAGFRHRRGAALLRRSVRDPQLTNVSQNLAPPRPQPDITRCTHGTDGCGRRYASLGEALFAIGTAVEHDPDWAVREIDSRFRSAIFGIAQSIDSTRNENAAPVDSVEPSRQHSPAAASSGRASPRAREVLARLLSGDGEKQIAVGLGISRHTVHVYVKQLYRIFGVCSRPELLSLWIKR